MMTDKNKTVFVLGMHRSGTSALAKGLSVLGIDWGGKLISGDNSNPKGYHEDMEVVRVNQQILTIMTSDPDYAMTMAGRVDFDMVQDRAVDQAIEEIIKKKSARSKFWGCKDPRLSITFPLWRKALLRQNIDTTLIAALRNPLEVAASLKTRDGFTLQHGLFLWYAYNYSVLQVAAETPTLIVQYDDLLKTPSPTLKRIALELSIGDSCSEKDLDEYAENFLDNRLKHHTTDMGKLDEACSDFPEIATLYRILTKFAEGIRITREDLKEPFDSLRGFGMFHQYMRSIPPKECHYLAKNYANELKHKARLYYDMGDGFSGEHMVAEKYNSSKNKVSFMFQESLNIRAVRLDPCETPCIVNLEKVVITYQDKKSENLVPVSSNAISNENGRFVFATRDPQLFFDINDEIWTVDFHFQFIQADDFCSLELIDAQEHRAGGFMQKLNESKSLTEKLRQEKKQANQKAEQSDKRAEQSDKRAEQSDKRAEQSRYQAGQLAQKVRQSNYELEQSRVEAEQLRQDICSVQNGLEAERKKTEQADHTIRLLSLQNDHKQQEILEAKAELSYIRTGLISGALFNLIKRNGLMIHSIMEIYRLKKSGLFDVEYYLKSNEDVREARCNPIWHFIKSGWKEGRSPSAYFDTGYYLRSNPDVQASGINPLSHFIKSGWKEGRNPSAYFDTGYYLRSNPDVRESGINPLSHFIKFGWKEDRSPSPYFDMVYYKKNNLEQLNSNLNPLQHYVESGWHQGCNPCAYFDPQYYLETYSDMIEPGTNPLLHYVESGWHQGCSPCAYFDPRYYLETYSDIIEPGTNPLRHYVESGWHQGCNPCAYFDADYYLRSYPDLNNAGKDPLLHYIETGWREGGSPSLFFNSQYYLEKNPDVSKSGKEPLSHYLKSGWHEMRNPCVCFDIEFYLKNNPDIGKGVEPLSHYIENGRFKGWRPSVYFDADYYLENNEDIRASGTDPLLHYLEFGIREGRKANALDLVPVDAETMVYEHKKPCQSSLFVKVIAFYLPQFHPISENNKWWGEGFTEWTNVTKSKPLFKGHHQPQLPDALGFYDLRMPEVMEKQADLAREFGIHGFCFHHYYFSGKRLLETPVDIFLKHPEIDIHFCLCWANENWTRRWDGQENEILIGQEHTPEDDIRFLEDLEKYLEDSRYITVEGRPVLIIYRPALFPEMRATIKRWQSHRRGKNQKELYLVMAMTFGDIDPDKYGFDAAVEFPPHPALHQDELKELPSPLVNIKALGEDIDLVDGFEGQIMDYNPMVECCQVREREYPVFKTAFPAWDNTARRGRTAHLFINATPENYYAWMLRNIKYSYDRLPESCCFTFVNAWNEWAEGAHLEPDRKYGYAFLNATSRALSVAEAWSDKYESLVNQFDENSVHLSRKILVIIHLYYIELAEEIIQYLKNIPCDFDICISTGQTNVYDIKEIFKKHFPQSKVVVKGVANKGYDIAPFVVTFGEQIMQYPLVCKIHGKKSNYNKELNDWRHHIFENLLGSKYIVNDILTQFHLNENLGMVYPVLFEPVGPMLHWGYNYDLAKKLFKRMDIQKPLPEEIEFPSGSMFWFRPEALHKLFECGLTFDDFTTPETALVGINGSAIDGTMAHAIERIFSELIMAQGFDKQVVDYSKDRYGQSEKEGWQYCPICEKETNFDSNSDWLRDHYRCSGCQSLPRDRQFFKMLHEKVPAWKALKTLEFAPCNNNLKDRVDDYTGSHYHPESEPGILVDGFINQNVEKLTFQDHSYDLIVHLDIMEHLFNPGKAVQEMLRVLTPSGYMVFTVPISQDIAESVRRAKLTETGEVKHLLKPMCHGNPVSDDGSLVVWDFGRDFGNLIKEWCAGFNVNVEILNKEDMGLGIEGEYLDCIMITKLNDSKIRPESIVEIGGTSQN